MKIPAQLQRGDIGFLIVRKNSKEPVEQGWNKKLYDGFEDHFYDALQDGFNYGISPLTRRIAIVDGDTEEIRRAMDDLSPTFSFNGIISLSPLQLFPVWIDTDPDQNFPDTIESPISQDVIRGCHPLLRPVCQNDPIHYPEATLLFL